MRRVHPILLRLLPPLLALAVLAACANPSHSDFGRDFGPVNEEVVSVGDDLGRAVAGARTGTDPDLARDLRDCARRLQEARADLELLDTPEDLRPGRDGLSRSMQATADELRDVAGANADGDLAAARTATLELARQADELRRRRQALARDAGL